MDSTGQTIDITVKTYDGNLLGTISVVNGELRGSDPGAQDIADTFLSRADGDVNEAVKSLDGYQNGYIFASSDPDATVN
jgi:hypothetical protein